MELPQSFIMHYYDDDFGDYFTLDSDDNIEDKMTVKIVASTAVSVTSTATPGHSSESSSENAESSTASSTNLRTKDITAFYALPKFEKDIEMALRAANVSYEKDGIVTSLSHGLKSRVLTRIVSDIYENYSAYPTTCELEVVAKTLVSNYEGIKDEPGKGRLVKQLDLQDGELSHCSEKNGFLGNEYSWWQTF